jgi:hypothetical protein
MKTFLARLPREKPRERRRPGQSRLGTCAARGHDLPAFLKREQGRGMPALVGNDARRLASEREMEQGTLPTTKLLRFY